MLKKILYLFCAGVIALSFHACSATKSGNGANAITYTNNVKAIIDANCASTCHNAAKPAGGIDLTNYSAVKSQTLDGLLIKAIQHAEGADPMPKKAPKMDDATIALIVSWANANAPE